jgi:hypothetical protein
MERIFTRKYFSLYFFSGALLISFMSLSAVAIASTTNGTIATNNYAWGENLGWINFGCTNCTVHVTDTAVTGDVWSQQYGWINLSPTDGGVTNDGNGNLGGTAWSSGLGWIGFSGVVIHSSGLFTGVAGTQGSPAGRINFSCTNCSVVTDWRPASVRLGTSSSLPGTGESSGGGSVATSNRVTTFTASSSVSASSPTTPASSLAHAHGGTHPIIIAVGDTNGATGTKDLSINDNEQHATVKMLSSTFTISTPYAFAAEFLLILLVLLIIRFL